MAGQGADVSAGKKGFGQRPAQQTVAETGKGTRDEALRRALDRMGR